MGEVILYDVGREGGNFFVFTLFTGPIRSLSLKLSDTRVYEPQIRARLGTTGGTLVAKSTEIHILSTEIYGN